MNEDDSYDEPQEGPSVIAERRHFTRRGEDLFGHGFVRTLDTLGPPIERDLLRRFCLSAADDTPPPRTMVVVAHQDDEVIGLGARLTHLKSDVLIVHITDGSPRDPRHAIAAGYSIREQYAVARQAEVRAALALAGITDDRNVTLGCIDQEATVSMVSLTERMVSLIESYQPEVIVTHSYEGGHTDHDSTAFAVHTAWRILRDRGARVPTVIEMSSYHLRTGDRTYFEFLPWSEGEIWTLSLTREERDLKREMFRCFRSQWAVLRRFPLEVERFRQAPAYDFTQPPYAGVLDYERFGLALDGAQWRAYAEAALRELGVEANEAEG